MELIFEKIQLIEEIVLIILLLFLVFLIRKIKKITLDLNYNKDLFLIEKILKILIVFIYLIKDLKLLFNILIII